jgi:hypothetical protein
MRGLQSGARMLPVVKDERHHVQIHGHELAVLEAIKLLTVQNGMLGNARAQFRSAQEWCRRAVITGMTGAGEGAQPTRNSREGPRLVVS